MYTDLGYCCVGWWSAAAETKFIIGSNEIAFDNCVSLTSCARWMRKKRRLLKMTGMKGRQRRGRENRKKWWKEVEEKEENQRRQKCLRRIKRKESRGKATGNGGGRRRDGGGDRGERGGKRRRGGKKKKKNYKWNRKWEKIIEKQWVPAEALIPIRNCIRMIQWLRSEEQSGLSRTAKSCASVHPLLFLSSITHIFNIFRSSFLHISHCLSLCHLISICLSICPSICPSSLLSSVPLLLPLLVLLSVLSSRRG